MDFNAGQTIGDYEVLGVLGAGGMGKVYKVRSVISQRVEAIKILLPDLNAQPELAERFLREIRISAGLEHPNIACLRTAQRSGNQLVMVLEYVEGSTLRDLLQKGRLPLDRCLAYVSQALSALDYAHSKGVIHRDIKPGNIMVTPGGQVKLMDFGIARLATDAKLTKTGVMVGSVYYMSPEQIEGAEIDGRSDIYSLGVTLYEMVTGKQPFDGDSEFQIMAAHLKGAPQPPRELDQSLPDAMNSIILTALARNAGDRFRSAKAMQAALTSVMQDAAKPTVSFPSQSPATPSVAPLATPLAATGKSHRTLYMTAGSLATLAVLIGAAVELPNFRHASANAAKVVSVQPPVDKPLTATVPDTKPAAQATATAQPVTLTPESDRAAPPAIKAASERLRTVVEKTPGPEAPSGKLPDAVSAPSAAPTPEPAPQTANTATAPVDNTAETDALRDRMMLLGARVTAVRTSLDNLKRAQAQSGLGLRSDIVASEERLLYQMGEADNGLKAGNDSGRIKKRLDSAETELEKLESFLGR